MSEVGPDFVYNGTALLTLFSSMIFYKQGDRAVAQEYQFTGKRVTDGGGKLHAKMTDWMHSLGDDLPKNHRIRIWSVSYPIGGKMVPHQDSEEGRIRFVLCVTKDGKPRRIKISSPTERVYATVRRKNGMIEHLMAEPGEELILDVPSGGWYAMSGPGSGAGDSTWLHEPCAAKAEAVALLADVFMPVSQQLEVLGDFEEMLATQAPRMPANVTKIRDTINFDTPPEVDPYKKNKSWREISLLHYWCAPSLLVCQAEHAAQPLYRCVGQEAR